MYYSKVAKLGHKTWRYIIERLSVKTVAMLLILTLTFDGIIIPLQFSLLKSFEPQTAYAVGSSPTTPSGLTIGTVTASSVALSWTASTDPDGDLAGYKIERAPDSAGVPGTFAQIGTSGTASYTDSTASASTKYWYRVRAYDNAGNNSNYNGYTTTSPIYSGSEDGYIQAYNASSWASCLASTTGTMDKATSPAFVQAYNGYYCTRTFLPFNTSSIPDAASVDSATLTFYYRSDAQGSTTSTLVEGTQGTTLEAADFDNVGSTELVSSRFSPAVGSAGTINTALNATGLTKISKTGESYFVIRHARDFDGTPNPTSANEFSTHTSESTGTTNDPYVTVGYSQPVSATTLANTPTSPSASAASTSQINVSWASGGAQDHYHVKSSLDSYASNIYNSTGTSTSQSSLGAGTQYTYRIYGVNASDIESSSYASVSKYTLSNPPTLPVASDGTTSGINVSWTASASANHYHVYRDGVSGSGTLVHNAVATSFNDSVTGSHTYYIYSVNGDDVENSSYISDTGSSDTTAPTNPAGLTVGSVTTTSVPLSWTGSTDTGGSGVAGYKVERAPDSAGVPGIFAQIGTSGTTSYTDSTASASTKYWYRVRAYDNASNNSGYSSNVSTTTLANAPTSPSASAASTSQINVSWASGGAQDHYHVKSSLDSYASNIYNSTGTSTSQSGLTAGAQYTYRIYGVNASDVESSTYATVSKYTLSDPPTLPVATDGTYADKINVSWTAALTANHYHVYRDGVSGAGTLVYNTTGTSFDDTITGSHTYYIYSVNSDDVENSSYISDSGNTAVIPTAPTIGIPTALSPTSIQWNFTDNSSDETGFKLHDSAHTEKGTAVANASSITEGSLSANTQYTRHVHSYNVAGDSTASANAILYTLANTPTLPSASAASTSQINVSWASGGAQDHYHVKSSLDSYASNIYNSTGTSTSQSGLTAGAQYTYRIYGVNASDVESSTYATVSKYTLSDPPTLPVATDGTYADKINVSWTAALTANHYHVYRDGVSGAGTLVYNSTGTSFDDTTTGSHTYYIYSVNADDVENSSYISDNGSSMSTPTAPTIGTPTALSATSLRWNFTDNASNEAGFKLHDGADTLKASNAVANLSYLDEGSLSANAQYTRHVHSYNDAGDSSASASASAYTKIESPTGGTFGTVTTTSIDLSATGALSNLTSGSSGLLFENTTNAINSSWVQTNAWTNSLLSPNTQYTYQVSSRNGDALANSAVSIGSRYTLSAAPNVTADKTASTWYNNTDVVFTNAAGFGAAGVQYYRYVFDQNVSHTFDDTETQWTAGTLTRTASANGSWYLHVKGFNGDNVANGTQTYGPYYYDGTAPTNPSTLVATAASTTQINLSWIGSTDSGGSSLTGYKIERAPDNSGVPGTFAQIDTSTSASYNNTLLTPNTKYWYRVRAYDLATNNSNYTSNVSKTTLSDSPALPVATDNTYVDKINVSWTASLTADHYHVYRDGASGTGTLVHNSNGTSFDDTTTGSHTYYIYSVNSEDAENSSYVSDTGQTNPIPTAPTIGTPHALSNTSIRWNFTDNASNETGFRLHDQNHNLMATSAGVNASSITETGLSANTSYTRHIHAYNGAGDSAASATASKYTLAANPSIATNASTSLWTNSSTVSFSSNNTFGAGGVSYYRYALSQIAGRLILSTDTQWTSGELNQSITSGIYYLHIRAYNAEHVATSQVTYGPYRFDIEKPAVRITSHRSGEYVGGLVNLVADATDNVEVAEVSFYDNSLSNRIGSSSDIDFDTRKLNGARTIYGKAVDTAGNSTVSSIILNIDNVKPKPKPLPNPSPGGGGDGKGNDKNNDGMDEVKKGESVKIYYKIEDNFDKAKVVVNVYRRVNKGDFKKRLKKTLELKERRQTLRALYKELKAKKDKVGKRQAKQVKRLIKALNKKIKKYNPYKIKRIQMKDLGDVDTNKKLVFTYKAKRKGIIRIALYVYDQALNSPSAPIVKWIQVK